MHKIRCHESNQCINYQSNLLWANILETPRWGLKKPSHSQLARDEDIPSKCELNESRWATLISDKAELKAKHIK